MSNALPLSDLSSLLAREIAASATAAERRQRDEFVALADQFGGTVEEHRERTVTAARVREVVEPLLPRGKKKAAVLKISKATRARLAETLGPRLDAVLPRSGRSLTLRRDALDAVAAETLREDADARFHDARALLSAGVPKVQIRGVRLELKVLVHDDGRGAMVARLPDEKTDPAALSTMTVDVEVGKFPPMP